MIIKKESLYTCSPRDSEEKSQILQKYYNCVYEKIRLKDYFGAIADFTKAIELDTNKELSYCIRGDAKRYFRDYTGAIADFSRAIEINPNYALGYYKRGDAKRNFQDNIGAIADYSQSIEIDPNNAQVYSIRGQVKSDIDNYVGAIADYNECIEIDPGNAEAYYLRGCTKLILCQKERGCADLKKAGKLGYLEAFEMIKKYGHESACSKAY